MNIQQQKRNGEWAVLCPSDSFRVLHGMEAYAGRTVIETEWLDGKGNPIRWRVSLTPGERARLVELLSKEPVAAPRGEG